jgi:hypothetical protein
LRLSKPLSCDGEAVKEVQDENALKHMFDKAHLKRTADVNLDQPTAMYDAHHWWLAALKVRSERAAEK